MTDTTACIHCSERPSTGVGQGHMAESCLECIPEVIKKGVCPICLAQGHGNPEHMAKCKGKPPKVPKRLSKLPQDGRTLEQIHRDAAAQSSLAARREAAEALKAMSPDQREAYRALLKKEGADSKAARLAARPAEEQRRDPGGVMPTDRCGSCNTFLDDQKRCANDDCADKGKKWWG